MIGKKIILKGISQHGKNRVREQGNEWFCFATVDKVGFDTRPGPWLCLKAVKDERFVRTVRLNGDKNFLVEK